MMSKIKILFFAADPHSIPPDGRSQRLLLDEDIRQIQKKVRASEYRDAFEFDFRLAARLDDLLQALNEVRPDIVHFSGHGWRDGLDVIDRDGRRPYGVDLVDLTELFRIFRGQIRVIVLNACLTHAQADAIAQVVGCAIGMRGKIFDETAIIFGAAFYRGIGFGHSVQAAFDQACLALPSAERDLPHLATREDVDPNGLVLVRPEDSSPLPVVTEPSPAPPAVIESPPAPRWTKRVIGVSTVVGMAVAAAVAVVTNWPEQALECAWDQDGLPHLALGGPPTWVMAPTSGDPAGSGTDLEIAKAQQRARNDTAAFPHFKAAADGGNEEAMGYLGVAYLCGEGTARQTDRGFALLHKAAAKRDPRGMTALAFAYQHGIGAKRSRRWSRYWYRLAAKTTRFPEAMRRLGGSYEDDADVDSAAIWYRQAIDAGSAEAMVDLGSLHETGPAPLRDLEHARALYDSAATAGSARGMLAMGHVYHDGVGVPRDYVRAMEWYQRAMGAGSIEAMNSMGVLYQHGLGVSRSREQAAYWFRRAQAAGSRIASENLSRLGFGSTADLPADSSTASR